MNLIEKNLSEFKEDDFTVKIIDTLLNLVPIGVSFQFYNQFENGLRRVKAQIIAEDIEKAKQIANRENVQSVLNFFSIIDTSDKIIAGYTGIKNVLNLFGSKNKKRTFESDPQQALDAGVKGLAIAYAIQKLYSGSIQEKISKFKETPAGVEMLVYYTLMEVALPFTDNLIEGSMNTITKLFANQNLVQNKISELGMRDILDTTEAISSLKETLPTYLDRVKSYVEPVANKIKAYLPIGMNIADSATGAVATGVDLLPIWTFLGTRLVIESIAIQL